MEKYGSKWSIIAQNMGNRSSLQCRSRWNSLQNKKNNVSKKDWTPEVNLFYSLFLIYSNKYY